MQSKKYLLLISSLLCFNMFLILGQELPQFVEERSQSVVSVIQYDQKNKEIYRGKGVIVSEDGMILTNYHLISNAHSVKIELYKGKIDWADFDLGFSHRMDDRMKKKGVKTKKVSIEGVVGVNKKLDLAVLKIKEKKLIPAPLDDSNKFTVGERLILISVGSASEGVITGVQEILKDKKIIQSTVPTGENMSGGAVFNAKGDVMGIITSFAEKTNFIIPVTNAIPLIKSTKLTSFSKLAKEDYFMTGEGLYLKGTVLLFDERYQEATQYLEEVIKLEPEKGEAYSSLGFLYSRLKENEKALSAYQEASRIIPDDYKIHFNLGKIYLKLKRNNEAINSLTQCTVINPDFPDAYYSLGVAYEALDQLEKAAEAYQYFAGINPGPAWTGLNQLGSVYVKLGQYDKAINAFEEVIQSNPEDLKANYNLAYSYDMSGQYERAAPLYRKLISLNPENANAYYGLLFRLHDKAAQYEKAVEVGQEIISLDPDNPNAQYNLGIIYIKLENYEKAIETFDHILSINPNFDPAIYNIGLVYSKQKKYPDAIQAFTKFTELKTDNPDAYYNIGAGYLQLKKYEQAIQPLQQAIALKSDYAIAHYNLALAYYAVGDRFSANEEYKTLKNLNPELAEKLRQIIHR